MNKEKLLTGDKVVFRNGQTALMIYDFALPTGGIDDVLVFNSILFMRLSMYDKELKHISDENYDITSILPDEEWSEWEEEFVYKMLANQMFGSVW